MGLAMHLLFAILVALVAGGILLTASMRNYFLSIDIVLLVIAMIGASMLLTYTHFRALIFQTKMDGDREGIWKRDAKHKLDIQLRENKRLVQHQLGLVDLIVYLEDQLINGRGRIYNRLTLSTEHRNLLQLFAPSATPVPAKPKEDYTGPERRQRRSHNLLQGRSIESEDAPQVRHDHVSAAIAASPPSAD